MGIAALLVSKERTNSSLTDDMAFKFNLDDMQWKLTQLQTGSAVRYYMEFKILTLLDSQIIVFWNVTPCRFLDM
jgi:hypothetical protein